MEKTHQWQFNFFIENVISMKENCFAVQAENPAFHRHGLSWLRNKEHFQVNFQPVGLRLPALSKSFCHHAHLLKNCFINVYVHFQNWEATGGWFPIYWYYRLISRMFLLSGNLYMILFLLINVYCFSAIILLIPVLIEWTYFDRV